jgi:hypothetical protein
MHIDNHRSRNGSYKSHYGADGKVDVASGQNAKQHTRGKNDDIAVLGDDI